MTANMQQTNNYKHFAILIMERLPMMTWKGIPYSFSPRSFDLNLYTALCQFASPYTGVFKV